MARRSPNERPGLSRRQALTRLGLGTAAVYSAPTILHLDRSARAVQPSCTGKGKGKGNPWCKASEPPESRRHWREDGHWRGDGEPHSYGGRND